jgi:hypothetical protein
MRLCKYCLLEGEGKYCFNCGEFYQAGRISIHSILHGVFTHGDKVCPGRRKKTNPKTLPVIFYFAQALQLLRCIL